MTQEENCSINKEVAPHEIPANWVWATLNDIGTIASGSTPSTKEEAFWGGDIPWLTPADLTGYKRKLIEKGARNLTNKGLNACSARLLPKGTILFSSRAPIGYTVIAANPIATNQGFKNLILSEELCNDYVYHYLKGNKQLAESYASGTTFKELSATRFRRIPIPIPPFTEQGRIVDKMEESFSKLEAGMKDLKRVLSQTKRFRQAVLKHAFEGKLTEKWRKIHEGQIEPIRSFVRRVLGDEMPQKLTDRQFEVKEMPDSWGYGKLDDWVYIAGRIGWRGLKASEYVEEGPLFLSVYNLNRGEGVKVDLSDGQHVTEERYQESPEIQLRENDILLVKDGAGIGKIGIVEGLNRKATVNSSLLVIRGKKLFMAKFLLYFLMGPKMQEIVKARITGSATPHLFQRDIKKFELWIPPLEEQQKIVNEVESRLSVIDEVEKTTKLVLKKAEYLRQSILGEAFKGKLVSQDPSDEPAEKLLERINVVKHKSENKKKREGKRR